MTKKFGIICVIAASLLLLVLAILANADENAWTTNGPYGASVKTIAIHPLDNHVIYLGTVGNGIYKTTDSGESWNHLDNGNIFSCMRVIAIHPFAPDTIYIASTVGMYKSSDAGNSWIFLTPPHAQNEIRAFMIHPVENNLLFAGGWDQWMSTNSGQSWFALNDIPQSAGIEALAVNPGNPDIIYLVAGCMLMNEGVWKSTDRGWSWVNIQNNIDAIGYGMDISVDPVDTNIIYLAKDNFPNLDDSSCLLKSTDSGQNWFDISPMPLSYPGILAVRVSPFNHNEVYIASYQDGVFKSTDGGTNWQSINNGLNINRIATIEIDSSSGIIYLGTYKDGIYRSTNNGESWQKISNNICSSWNNSLALDYHNSSSAYVAADNGLFKTTDSGQSWDYVNTGDLGHLETHYVAYDKYLPENIYYSTFHTIWPPLDDAGFYRSTDYGETWSFFNNGLPRETSYGIIRIAYFDDLSRRIFLCSSNGLYYSDDIGETWELITDGLPTDMYYVDIDVSPINPNIAAVSDAVNNIFISSDNGDSWTETNSLPYISGAYVNDLCFHPDDSDHIYACSFHQGLFESTDGGNSWENINNNLPLDYYYEKVSGITINPLNPQNMFVASFHYGIFQSHNGGQSWESFNVGMDTTHGSGDIMFALGDTTTLFFASTMRSVWSITRTPTAIDDDIALPMAFSVCNYPNPFNASTNIKFILPNSSDVKIDIYDMLGRRVSTIVNEHLFAGYHSVIWNPVRHHKR